MRTAQEALERVQKYVDANLEKPGCGYAWVYNEGLRELISSELSRLEEDGTEPEPEGLTPKED